MHRGFPQGLLTLHDGKRKQISEEALLMRKKIESKVFPNFRFFSKKN